MIYTDSFLTIAATSASRQEESCLWPHVPWAQVHHDDSELPTPVTFVGHSFDQKTNIQLSPLNRRAWVLQEMLLSYRVLHLARDELYWVCAEMASSEDCTVVVNPIADALTAKSFYSPNGPNRNHDIDHEWREEMRHGWWMIVEEFSSRTLTKESDRLPATAGMVQVITRRTIWNCLAGLWEEDLYFNLLWYVIGERRIQRVEDIGSRD